MPGCAHSVAAPAARACARAVNARWGSSYPAALALLYDANKAPTRELVGKGHTFNHAILSPQYQRNADGSYTDVGANPAVDVFDGEKWLRTCGAVTNMLTNSVFEGAVSGTPGTAPTGWSFDFTEGSLSASGNGVTISASAGRMVMRQFVSILANSTYIFSFSCYSETELSAGQICTIIGVSGATVTYFSDDILNGSTIGQHKISVKIVTGDSGGDARIRIGVGASSKATGSVTISRPMLTTLLNAPYVASDTTGPVTMPASNATATNGCWFTLADGSPVWKALTGEPLTLATRVRMGVWSEDLPSGTDTNNISSGGNLALLYTRKDGLGGSSLRSYDGSPAINVAFISHDWPRNSIINRVTQVSADATQYRVGYMIEGTHTTIQWSAWANYDGSFDPSTLYRLMLGYNNPHPMWYNKIAVWNTQVDDATILKWMKP